MGYSLRQLRMSYIQFVLDYIRSNPDLIRAAAGNLTCVRLPLAYVFFAFLWRSDAEIVKAYAAQRTRIQASLPAGER